jgi:hypothetical protein
LNDGFKICVYWIGVGDVVMLCTCNQKIYILPNRNDDIIKGARKFEGKKWLHIHIMEGSFKTNRTISIFLQNGQGV